MKKTIQLTLLLITLLSFSSNKAYSADFASVNDEGVTICFNYINNSEVEVTYFGNGRDTYSGTVVIPEEVWTSNLYVKAKVTRIGKSAFAGSNVTSVTIPNTVTSIGEKAFYNCRILSSISIGNSVKKLNMMRLRGAQTLLL